MKYQILVILTLKNHFPQCQHNHKEKQRAVNGLLVKLNHLNHY